MFIASVATLVASVACAFCIKVLKNMEIAILIPTIFCGIAFTVYTFTGLGEGVALLWSLLMPIGMCYFVSVKYGMILSAYYSVLFSVVFYTPLRENLSLYYSDSFMRRFPIIYISLSIFTDLAMYQYHKNALLEIDYSERLNEEVRKQTAVAKERSMKIEEMSFQTIRTLADAFDAMNSDRVYRKACDLEHIRNELVRGKGKQFDPEYISNIEKRFSHPFELILIELNADDKHGFSGDFSGDEFR